MPTLVEPSKYTNMCICLARYVGITVVLKFLKHKNQLESLVRSEQRASHPVPITNVVPLRPRHWGLRQDHEEALAVGAVAVVAV